tara:strand:+ start:4651 stop:5328 length:678 start_codon:yes stop_codon:yes gene_type:complete
MYIVTGGSSGIGKAIADHIRNEGEEVFTLSRKEIKGDSNHFSCDISDYQSLRSVYLELLKKDTKIYGLINCAGVASMNLAMTTPPKVTEKVIQTNLMGTIYCNQIFSPLLIKNKRGRIINFSTIAVHLGLKGESIYAATKAGVESFSRVFAKELSPFKITVNCVAPGPIRTNLLRGITNEQIKNITNNQIIQKEMNLKDVIDIVDIILDVRSQNITGQVLHVGGV